MKPQKTPFAQPARQLTLHRETLQQLADTQLEEVVGGVTNNCTDGKNCTMW